MGVGVGDREVRRVYRQRELLVLDVHAHVGEREVAVDALGDGNRLYAVVLLLVEGGIQGIVKLHIGVERVVLRADDILAVRVIEWCTDLRLIGEELTQLDICRNGVGLLRLGGALQHGLLQSTEAVGHVPSTDIDGSDVAQLEGHGS